MTKIRIQTGLEFRDVFVEEDSFKTLMASAIEVYSRETNGVLLGGNTTREISGEKRKVLSIKDVYPIQTAKRKRSEVYHGNMAAIKRFLRATSSLRTDIVGGFHSHPHPFEGNTLSGGDVDFVRDEVKVMSRLGQKKVEKGWMEILMSINRKNYRRPGVSKWYTCSFLKKINCKVRTQKRVGYDVMVSAFWVYPKEIVEDEIRYGVKEVPVHVPWLLE